MLKEKVDVTATKLGLDKIEPPIFYNCPVGIRFEIGVGSPYLFLTMPSKKYVRTALQRAYTIYQNTPSSFDTLLWILYPDREKSEKKLLHYFGRITGLPLPQERFSTTLPQDDSRDEPEEELRCYWDLKKHDIKAKKLLEEIIKADIGGFCELVSSIFLLDTNLNILFHLYDDRGLDVVAEYRDTIAHLYYKFGDWVLKDDKEQIHKTFEG
ncbi:DUF3885 domain-containing protein [Dehalobacter sp. DCM]|uniref:DUF3885 domain-containing protein n=1 Tax=Dehalobacter sp. DCM TaxID=2907827 RepID=UPI0030819630|nr:DUF3885 domain-containing protein [Dehalobacter sp. DCM]